MYVVGDKVSVNDRMQHSYEYVISEQTACNYASGFEPYLTPKEMLHMGVLRENIVMIVKKSFRLIGLTLQKLVITQIQA